MFALSGLIAIIGIIRGPSFADRTLASGVFINITIILLMLYTMRTQSYLYLDISIVMIFMSFVGTLAIAKYSRRKHD